MHIVALSFGLACGACVALARFAPVRDRGDATFLAVVLLASWAVSNVAWLHNSLETLALMDGAIAALALLLWRLGGGGWRLWFLALAIAQLALDALYAWLGEGSVVPYIYAYNLTFAGEIIAVAWGGGKHVGNDWVRRVSRLRHVLRTARSARKVAQ